ncbi:probable cytochrome P450 4d14 [Stomoxys calcitrans]|uniref:probable cytochrome P450 4d14 n=1 Tax=Stomoxys calcitrans TaxID=35570 RepID=UPI0027E2A6DC|nr:probable cytochrome P450 4d14 [Stomoxys calcitrans]
MLLELLWGFLTILIVCDTLYKRRRHRMLQNAGVPGPSPWPIFGNIQLFVGNNSATIFSLFKRLSQTYGKLYRLWMVNDCVLFIQDPEFFEAVFKSQQVITKNGVYSVLQCWLGQGLLLSSGSKWFARRRIITPTFHFTILEEFVEIFDQQSRIMVKRLMKKADGKTVVNLFPEVCLTALDIIAETAMGVKINAQEHPEFPYAKAVTDCATIMAARLMKPFDRFDWYFRIVSNKSYRHMNKCLKVMHDFTDKVIEERRDALQKSIEEGTYQPGTNATNEFGIKKRLAFLDVLLQSTVDGQALSNEDIREEVDTFMFEGHDTTTSGISHTLYLLARHPEVQKKVLQEIHEVIGKDKETAITMQQLQELKYLDCVVKESLRLYPPVPIIGRLTEQDIELNGMTIPANTNLSLLIYAACRDPDYFSQPDDVIPERFDANSETAAKINPFAYVPFSAGSRNCIGQKFALLEMKCTIIKMISYFELLPLGAEVKPVMNLILRSETGINVGLKKRV